MDKLILQTLELIEEDVTLKISIEKLTNEGALLMAKTRYFFFIFKSGVKFKLIDILDMLREPIRCQCLSFQPSLMKVANSMH